MLRIPTQQIPDLFKIGEVSSIDPVKCTARVVFDDEDSLNSYDLPIMQRNTFGNHDYGMVDVGEDVLVMFLGPGQEDGFIIGSFYAGEVTPPESSADKRTVVFKDGTRFSYDRATHTFTATIEGTEIVFDRQKGTITVPDSVTINCATAQVNASGSATVDSPTVTITGDTTIQKTLTVVGHISGTGGLSVSGGGGASVSGSLTTTGDVTAGGISLQNHTHTGVHGETSTPH